MDPTTMDYFLDDYPHVAKCTAEDRFVVQRITARRARLQPFVTTSRVPALRVSTALVPVAGTDYSLALDGREIPAHDVGRFTSMVVDLAAEPTTWSRGAYEYLHFVIRRTSLDDVAADLGFHRIGDIRTVALAHDLVLSQLARTSIKLFDASVATSLALEDLELILAAHVVQRYGGVRRRIAPQAAVLPRWKQRRAEEMIAASLAVPVRLADLARECELSVSHFSRAFKATYGVSAHRWLLERRIEHAKHLLERTRHPLIEIASLSGFVDQSVFTRTFRKVTGTTPAAWRRETARNDDT